MRLRAGAAAADISPVLPVALFGYPHVPRISTGIHDPLLASALFLDNGSQSAVLIALDLLMLDPPTARAIRRAVAQRVGVAEASVFVSCTHTHSGPVTARLLAWQEDPTIPPPDTGYLDCVRQRAAQAAAQAIAGASDAEIAWSTADARGVGGNRLAPDGVTDPEAGVLTVRKAGGPLVAVAVVYGMHPTVLHEDSTLVSSDFPHYTRLQLREQFGPSLTVLYHTAPSGNQSPRFFVSGQAFDEAERLGRKLGRAIVASVEKLEEGDFRGEGPLRGVLCSVDLPRRSLPTVAEAERLLDRYRAEYDRLQSEHAARPAVRTAECSVFGAEGTLALARLNERGDIDRTLESYRPIEVQALRIGDACLAGLPGECFVEYALQIKRRWPGRVFVVSLVNGELQGYLVTPEAAAQGGYEAMTSLFSPQAGQVLVEKILELSDL
jgi:hypothetical protein